MSIQRFWLLVIVIILSACSDSGDKGDEEYDSDAVGGGDADADSDPESCDFGYDQMFVYDKALSPADNLWQPPEGWAFSGEMLSPTWTTIKSVGTTPAPSYIVMPPDTDDMPIFDRAEAWIEDTRCFELPDGAHMLTEDEAFDHYREIAEKTTGLTMDTSMNVRSVVGLRGAYVGTVGWHGNSPDRFNDTLALLWIDGEGTKHVREFPAGLDTGAYDYSSMSSLRPNMRYHHYNGWHQSTYNALHMGDTGYQVMDDANSNGHWDSDRNGWFPPTGSLDFDRIGGGHNIHLASVNAPLGTAKVGAWSAGCQVIPGYANWDEFITMVWTNEGDNVDYFLADARDIPPEVWEPCLERDGSRSCPYKIDSFPFSTPGSTSTSSTDEFDVYNCSTADESGPEDVYVFTIDNYGTLEVTVECDFPIGIDTHLLDGDDPDACLTRAHESFTYDITPGRYFIVADTYTDGVNVFHGAYNLTVTLG